MMCKQEEEDIGHVLLSCQAYSQHREKLFTTVRKSYSRGNSGVNILEAGAHGLLEVLLGVSAGCKLTEDEVDRATKRFLRKAWKARRGVTAAINQEFGRMDVQWMAREPGWYRPKPAGQPANHIRVGERKDRGPLPRVPGRGGEAAKGTAALVQPGTEQKREGKMGGREKGVRRRLVLV